MNNKLMRTKALLFEQTRNKSGQYVIAPQPERDNQPTINVTVGGRSALGTAGLLTAGAVGGIYAKKAADGVSNFVKNKAPGLIKSAVQSGIGAASRMAGLNAHLDAIIALDRPRNADGQFTEGSTPINSEAMQAAYQQQPERAKAPGAAISSVAAKLVNAKKAQTPAEMA